MAIASRFDPASGAGHNGNGHHAYASPRDTPDMRAGKLYRSSWGWSVIPVDVNKAPIVDEWTPYRQKFATVREVEDWSEWPGFAGYAVLCGLASSRVTVRDFDTPDGYRLWAKENPKLAAKLPTSKTSRGYHVYFDSSLTRTIKSPKDWRPAPGELKGSGYVVLPPSVHATGVAYSWIIEPKAGHLPKVDYRSFLPSLGRSADEFPIDELSGEVLAQDGARAGDDVVDPADDSERQRSQKSQRVRSHISAVSASLSHSAPSSSPFPDRASTHSLTLAFVDGLIRRCLPQRDGQRNACIFDLARGLKFEGNKPTRALVGRSSSDGTRSRCR